MFFIDPVYLVCVLIPVLIISFAAQMYLNSTYNKWSKIRNSSNLTGTQIGKRLLAIPSMGGASYATLHTPELDKLEGLRDQGIITGEEFEAKKEQVYASGAGAYETDIRIAQTSGVLTDNYDPRNRTLNLSQPVARQPSVVSMAVTAHETGHAQQHMEGSFLIKVRGALVPAIRFSPIVSYICILLGVLFNITGLLYLGILFFGLMVLFALITLPIELDASKRGLKLLREGNLIQSSSDEQGSKQVLRAAALTYVAAAITAILQLFYYIGIARRRS
ncbi:MAG: hypothetical protein GTO18_05505 [Anaerolineales bacterium]|nr:hypothetical protein [Anaerolineales bacterium]